MDQAVALFGLPDPVSSNIATQRTVGTTSDCWPVMPSFSARRTVLHAGMLALGGTANFTVNGTRGSLVKRRMHAKEAQLISGLMPDDMCWGVDGAPPHEHDGSGVAPRDLGLPIAAHGRFELELPDAIRSTDAAPVTPIQAFAMVVVWEAAGKFAYGRTMQPLRLMPAERAACAVAS